MSAGEPRIEEAIRAFERGWVLTPLVGKKPRLKRWTTEPPPSLAQVLEWARRGNLGLRTGAISQVLVVDEDASKGGSVAAFGLPKTVTAITGGGGRHLYFEAPKPCPGNTAGRVAPHVDTRGEGGQVVFVGSVHPDTQVMYTWAPGCSPDELPIAALPRGFLEKAIARTGGGIQIARASQEQPPQTVREALRREFDRVSRAQVGARNASLNFAAYYLGRLVGGRYVPESVAYEVLARAAEQCGLLADDGEAQCARTIESGLTAGMRVPWR